MATAAANKHKIQAVPNWATGTWVPVVCPISECRGFSIFNQDASLTLSVCTDTSDAASVISIPAAQQYQTEAGVNLHKTGFQYGDVICFVKGNGAQPVAIYVQ